MTCIMVTHNPDLECYADRVLYIEDGQVCTTLTCFLLTISFLSIS